MPSVNPKPAWLKIQLNTNNNFTYLRSLTRKQHLTTVCQEAKCPNIHECWGQHRTATFMILGDTCTRHCRFCAVATGRPGAVDTDEPHRIAQAVREMGLRHVVITMVNRDDLSDGGASILALTVNRIHDRCPDTSVEVLSSDLEGDAESIRVVCESRPEIMSHNLETVRRLTPDVRSKAGYDRSLEFLKVAKEFDPASTTKSSLMLGLGETREEILTTMDDLLSVGVSILNLGQYLQPTRAQLPVQKYWTPQEFEELHERAIEKGFDFCQSGPLVRSSYHAGEQQAAHRRKDHPLGRQNPA